MSHKKEHHSKLTLSALLICLLALPTLSQAKDLKRGDPLPPTLPFVMESDAIESIKIEFDLDMSGQVQAVYAQACIGCAKDKFISDKNTIYRLGQTDVSRENLYELSGKSGTVVFNKKTKVLSQVNFFDLED